MNTPAETAARFLAVGREKVLLPVGRMACLAVMAGFFIGLAGVGASTAAASVPPAAARAGQCLRLSGGACDGDLDRSGAVYGQLPAGHSVAHLAVTARQVLRSWIVVYLGNFVGAVLAPLRRCTAISSRPFPGRWLLLQ